MNNEKPTPETDAQGFGDGRHPWVGTDFARKLERERDSYAAKLVASEAYEAGLLAERNEALDLARELWDALDGVLFSASPSRMDNPTMFAAWEEARPILTKAKEALL